MEIHLLGRVATQWQNFLLSLLGSVANALKLTFTGKKKTFPRLLKRLISISILMVIISRARSIPFLCLLIQNKMKSPPLAGSGEIRHSLGENQTANFLQFHYTTFYRGMQDYGRKKEKPTDRQIFQS